MLRINGSYSRTSSLPSGWQTIIFELNKNGTPIRALPTGEIILDDATYIDTGWKPNFDEYTIEMNVEYEDGSRHHCKYVCENGLYTLYIDDTYDKTWPISTTTNLYITNKIVGSNIKYKKLLAPLRIWKKVI